LKSKAEIFFESIKNKKVAFIGIGVSHIDTAKLFLAQGIETIVCDRRERDSFGTTADELENLGANLRFGNSYLENLGADIVFRSPGVYFYSKELSSLRDSGAVITSEMEVFFDLCPCKTIAVTGSEGKTTTTTIISEMLKAQGKTVHLGGNIGKALLPIIFEITPDDFAVVELSSFQLLSMRPSPAISIVTNLTPDHLDVHSSMEEYVDAKRNIFLHQNAFSRTVLNDDNAITKSFEPQPRGERMMFSLSKPVHHGAYLQDGILYRSLNGKAEAVISASDIKLPGLHNVANYLTAICAVTGYVDSENILKAAKEFGGVEHRLELVREVNGVKWYNDSIATAPPAVIAGLRAFSQKLIIIGGGYDKNIPFDDMAPDIVERVKLLILTGPTAVKIEAAVKNVPAYKQGSPEIIMAADIPEAVKIAAQNAKAGDIVSLSPASASFDAYPNFAARGRHFKELVNVL